MLTQSRLRPGEVHTPLVLRMRWGPWGMERGKIFRTRGPKAMGKASGTVTRHSVSDHWAPPKADSGVHLGARSVQYLSLCLWQGVKLLWTADQG